MLVELHRLPSTKQGTFGTLFIANHPICVTCEDPWENNHTGISCIPPGTYQVQKYTSANYPPKYKDVWQVMNVLNRTLILIHNGNTIEDTMGCILVGESFAKFGPLPGINNSVKTLKYLRTILPDNFTLVIK